MVQSLILFFRKALTLYFCRQPVTTGDKVVATCHRLSTIFASQRPSKKNIPLAATATISARASATSSVFHPDKYKKPALYTG